MGVGGLEIKLHGRAKGRILKEGKQRSVDIACNRYTSSCPSLSAGDSQGCGMSILVFQANSVN